MAKNEFEPGFFHPGNDAEPIPPGPGESKDPDWPLPGEDVMVPIPKPGELAADTAGPWFVQLRLFDRFKEEEVPTRKKTRTEEQQTDTREANDGKGKCWTECRVIERTYETPYFMVTQYMERWRINTSLRTYYQAIFGEEATAAQVGVGAAGVTVGNKAVAAEVAKHIAKSAGKQVITEGAAGAAGAGVAGVAGALGVGVILFYGLSFLTKHYWIKDAVRISAGWMLRDDKSHYGTEKLVRQTTAYWKRCSEVRDCLTPQKSSTGAAIDIPGAGKSSTGAAIDIPGAGKSSTGATLGIPSLGTKKLPMISLGAGLFVLLLILASLGLCGRNQAPGSAPAATIATPSLPVAVVTPLVTAQGAAFDPCTLVTTAEAEQILEKPVTATTSGTRCTYRPQTPAVFQVPTDGGTASIRIDSVVVTAVTGRDAASRYASFEAISGRDPWDQQVAGLGDKAIYTRGSDLSVLQGTSFIGVSTSGNTSLPGSSTNKYLSVREWYIRFLEAFARPALERLSSR